MAACDFEDDETRWPMLTYADQTVGPGGKGMNPGPDHAGD